MSCSGGGTLDTSASLFGTESRSLRGEPAAIFFLPSPLLTPPSLSLSLLALDLSAAHGLIQAGFKNVKHLEGGINAWKSKGLPMAGKKHTPIKRGKWFVNV